MIARSTGAEVSVDYFKKFTNSQSPHTWSEALKEFGLRQLVGGHCTGIHEARKIADIANIHQSNLSHGAIGTVVTKDLKIIRSSVE